jgi:hypothetical protein
MNTLSALDIGVLVMLRLAKGLSWGIDDILGGPDTELLLGNGIVDHPVAMPEESIMTEDELGVVVLKELVESLLALAPTVELTSELTPMLEVVMNELVDPEETPLLYVAVAEAVVVEPRIAIDSTDVDWVLAKVDTVPIELMESEIGVELISSKLKWLPRDRKDVEYVLEESDKYADVTMDKDVDVDEDEDVNALAACDTEELTDSVAGWTLEDDLDELSLQFPNFAWHPFTQYASVDPQYEYWLQQSPNFEPAHVMPLGKAL